MLGFEKNPINLIDLIWGLIRKASEPKPQHTHYVKKTLKNFKKNF
jgi:hypothetical protein